MYKVKIIKCSGGRLSWYRGKIGLVYIVDEDFFVIDTKNNFLVSHIREEDCEIIAKSKTIWEPVEKIK